MAYSDVKDKDKDELLRDLCGGSEPSSQIFEQLKSALAVQCVTDLQIAIKDLRISNEHIAASNDQLSRKIFALNVVLVIATVVGTVAALFQAYSVLMTTK
jgi:hypothetical protein